jgi:hypothetical protein
MVADNKIGDWYDYVYSSTGDSQLHSMGCVDEEVV